MRVNEGRVGDGDVDQFFAVDEPEWYSRLSLPFRRSWRREVATIAGVFTLGLGLGLLIGLTR